MDSFRRLSGINKSNLQPALVRYESIGLKFTHLPMHRSLKRSASKFCIINRRVTPGINFSSAEVLAVMSNLAESNPLGTPARRSSSKSYAQRIRNGTDRLDVVNCPAERLMPGLTNIAWTGFD